MFKTLTMICALVAVLSSTAIAQSANTLSINLLDPNGDSIAVGVVSLTDAKGKKIAEIEIGKTKKASVFNLEAGNYVLEIQSPGFKTFQKTIEIKTGENSVEARLKVEELKVNIDVRQSERERRMEEAFSGYLSEREIAALPETGEDIKEELQRRYGDDVLIRIDGDFDGSHIPSRAEISSVKVVRNTFDAEFHEIGLIVIDVRTNTITTKFGGFANLLLNISGLNARNPFDATRRPSRTNNLMFFISGPLVKNKTSFSFSTFGTDRVNSQNFVGATPDGAAVAPQQTGQRLMFSTFGVKHVLAKNRTLNFKYQNSDIKFENIGFGAFDLPGRGTTRRSVRHKFGLAESGTFAGRYANDFRIEFAVNSERNEPNSTETTVLVLNAFNAGGSGTNNRTDGRRFAVADNLLFDAGAHSLKMGAELEYERLSGASENNRNGTFVFLNLRDYINRRPAQFSQTSGSTEYRLSQTRGAFYFQDYFKLHKAFQIGWGVRYEWQSDVKDYNNFSPRFGWVWSPEKSGKLIIRGGVGVFYDWLDTQTLAAILSNDGRQGRKIIVGNPGFPDPFDGGFLAQPLPPSVSRLADDLKTPQIFVAQNGFNYKLDKSLTFEGIYTFKKGSRHFRSRNINAPIGGVRPNPDFGLIQLLESAGNSLEHSFELKTNAYFKGINMFGNYRLGREVADFSSPLGLPADNYNPRLERGLTNFDQTHKLNVGVRYEVFKSVNVSASFRAESGFPYTVTTGRDDNGDTVFNDRPAGTRRNSERGEWLRQTDLQLRWKLPLKSFGLERLGERRSVSLNANVRNLFNTSNLINYIGMQTSPVFGRPTSARAARSVELGLTFGF